MYEILFQQKRKRTYFSWDYIKGTYIILSFWKPAILNFYFFFFFKNSLPNIESFVVVKLELEAEDIYLI